MYATTGSSHSCSLPTGWDAFLKSFRTHVDAISADVLFTTGVRDLYDTFLDALPVASQPEHRCQTCRRFVNRYGSLVSMDAEGRTTPVMWTFDAPAPYAAAVARTRRRVAAATVDGVHVDSARTWGQPTTGPWTHLSMTPPAHLVFDSSLETASQRAAKHREAYALLCRGLVSFRLDTFRTAHRMLADGLLARPEKCLGVAKWLLDLKTAQDQGGHRRRWIHLRWRAIGSAPPGWAHVRSGMIGTLLEDIDAGMHPDRVRARFNDKMDPLRYLRPTKAPKAGNVAAAERTVSILRTEGALERRFARMRDIRPLWTPREVSTPKTRTGVFAGLVQTARASARRGPEVPITWRKFSETVLPDASRIDVLLGAKASMYAFVTAAQSDAPPILQWDHPEDRNPVSWYTYPSGSSPRAWGVGRTARCVAVSTMPFEWTSNANHQGRGALFVLEGCEDRGYTSGAGYFPEQLKAAYHPVRATMEAHAKRSRIRRVSGQQAAGVAIRENTAMALRVRVTRSDGSESAFVIDRWD